MIDWTALAKAVALCLVSVIIEAVSATKDGKQWFESLKRPKYSFPLQVWYVVGAIYYFLFGVIAYKQFAMGMTLSSMSIILLITVMLINGFSLYTI